VEISLVLTMSGRLTGLDRAGKYVGVQMVGMIAQLCCRHRATGVRLFRCALMDASQPRAHWHLNYPDALWADYMGGRDGNTRYALPALERA